MATTPSPYPAFPSATTYPPHPYGCYYPPPIPYPNQPPPPSPSYHAAAYHHHHRFQLPPPSHPNPHWHQGVQQMQPPPPAPGIPWHPHHAAAQPPPPSPPPPRRPPPSSPPPLAASMAAVAPAWPFPSASVPAVQEGAAPSTSSSGRLPFQAPSVPQSPPSPPYHYAAIYPPPPPGFVPFPASLTPIRPYEPQWPPPAPNPPTIQAPPQPTTTSSTPNSYPGRCFQPPPAQPVTTAVPIPLLAESSSPTSPTTAPASRTVQRHATDRFTDRLPSTLGQAACAPSSDEDDHEQDAVQRLDKQQESMDKMQGDMSNLMAMVSQISISLGNQPEHALANSEAPPSSAARPLHCGNNTSAPLSSSPVSGAFVPVHTSTTSTTVSAPAMSASTVPSAPAYATQLFGEMPTPKSCPRTYASALHYYQEHVTPVQSTFVPDRNNNLTEQHLDAMSEQYGFHNLNRHSVFLADGSKHSYFALLETYPLERAVPEPVFDVYDDETKGCTDEFVDEFASTPEQQLYEDPQVNVLVIHERRKEWDPGVSKLKDTILDKGAVQVQFVQQSTELSLFSLEFSSSSPKRVQWDPGVKISLYKWFNILTVWTAADKQLSCTHIPDLAAWQNQSVGGAASYIWDPGTLLWYKFIWWLFTLRTNFKHNSYSTPKH